MSTRATPITGSASRRCGLRERLGLDEGKLLLTFQSRFGNAEWLQPYTDKTVEELAKDGVKRIAVMMPGFSADCLETLEEIALENAEIFRHNGGETFSAIPCLNDSEAGIDVICQLVAARAAGLDLTADDAAVASRRRGHLGLSLAAEIAHRCRRHQAATAGVNRLRACATKQAAARSGESRQPVFRAGG